MGIELTRLALPGVWLLTPERHQDSRGYFCETWNARELKTLGLDISFVQDNQSYSAQAGTFEGCTGRSKLLHRASWSGCSGVVSSM